MTCESDPGELRYDPHRDEWQCPRCGYTSSSLNLSILGWDVARQEHLNHAKRARVSKTDPTNALPAHYQA